MKIKLKDLELAIEHIRSNSISESVDVGFGDDSISLLIEFTDKNKNISKIKTFETTVNATPEEISVKKLYRKS
jgi:hypothetical protein